MPVETIRVKGVKEVLRAFGKIDNSLRRELIVELKDVGDVVKNQAQQNYDARFTQRSGDAEKGFKTAVARGRVVVRNTARHRGFNYPARQEYEGGGRAFLGPALDEKRGEVIQRLEAMLDRIISAGGFGRGGKL